MKNITVVITDEQKGRKVESLLHNEFAMSDSHISRLKRRPEGITVNGEKAYTTAVLCAGDVLSAQICDGPEIKRTVPMDAVLNIVWEDEYLVIVDKPAGMAVHQSTRDPNEITLENVLAARFAPGENCHPVSRLDKGTTGLMTVAKSGYIHERLKRLLHTEQFRREYIGIAVGEVLPKSGSVRLPIGMEEGSVYKHAVREDGAPSFTEYNVLKSNDEYSVLRLIPHTGRTHQLRLHMAAIGFPLAGDWLYGSTHPNINRPALHSAELWLSHPITGEQLHIVSQLPEDMRQLAEKVNIGN